MNVSSNLVIYKVEFVLKPRLCRILSMFPNPDKNMKSDNVRKCKSATCSKMVSSFLWSQYPSMAYIQINNKFNVVCNFMPCFTNLRVSKKHFADLCSNLTDTRWRVWVHIEFSQLFQAVFMKCEFFNSC